MVSPEQSSSPTQGIGEIAAIGLVAGVHVVVVDTSQGKYRRRAYFNLPNAQRAADRATMAGHSARIVLCQLVPVSGDDL